ncbi:uncharacterized protein LOC143056355 [Mytilus galloprovincialis]|uniref:uncharacterized protein LOC143056355 n=1 Tax=Mytilus galloprovincialis TaxID=29158 RepID=UPI003F7C7C60
MAQIPSQNCTFCSKLAALYCYDCQQCLCTQCQKNIHGIVAVCRDHKVGDIHKAGNRIYKPVPSCVTHNKEFICYCGKCDCLTCKECITSSHNGHITKEIKNIADIRRQDVNQIIDTLKTKVEEIGETLKIIDGSHSLQIQSDCDSYIENVEKTYQEMYQIIDRNKLINVTTATDFRENGKHDLKRKRVFYQRLINEYSDRLLKFENLLQEPHDSTFFTAWKCLQTDFQIMTEETEQPLVCPKRIDRFNKVTFIRAVIEDFDNQFEMGVKEQEIALAKMTDKFGELRTEVENKQRTINEVTKEAVDKVGKVTAEFEEKIQHLEAKLTKSKEDNNKAVNVQENMKKQLSIAIDQCNREREENTKLQTIILKQEQDFKAAKRNNKDMKPNAQNKEQILPSQHYKKSSDVSHENIETFKLSYLEFKMLQFYCEVCQIFIGRCEYKDGVLMRYLNPYEKKANLQTVFKSKMDFIRSLASSTIASPSKISDEKFYEIKRAVSDTKEIYCDLADDKVMITLYASNYEILGEGKHKAEVALGLKQQSKGRRNRVFVTDTDDLSSSKKETTLASGVNQTVKSPTYFSRSLSSSSRPKIEMTFKTSEGIIVKVYNGNILSVDVDCIVNAANENLAHGGGVAYVIAAAAGYDFEKESDDYIQQNGPIKEGSCCTTSAGKLKYKSVIHTVGPKWHTYNDKRECCRVLRKSVECCFFEAEVNGMLSLATPSISSGIFGVPHEVCCKEYGKAVEDFSRKNGNTTCLKEIHFIDKDAGMITMIQKEFSQIFSKDVLTK